MSFQRFSSVSPLMRSSMRCPTMTVNRAFRYLLPSQQRFMLISGPALLMELGMSVVGFRVTF